MCTYVRTYHVRTDVVSHGRVEIMRGWTGGLAVDIRWRDARLGRETLELQALHD